jgi:hypothetical protein
MTAVSAPASTAASVACRRADRLATRDRFQ